jgi:hypothetical protein
MNGPPTRSSKPNLFASSEREVSSSSLSGTSSNADQTETAKPSRHILPNNLEVVIKRLDDQELDRLVAAALGERARRKRPPLPDAGQKKESTEAVSAHLPQGKLNAVRAAFKAGVKPTRIAKEFGLSRSEVQSALRAMNAKK